MRVHYDLTFILTYISLMSVFVMAYLIMKIKNKSQIQYIFLSMIGLLLFWNLGTILEMYFRQLYNYTEMIFVNISYLGITFIPVLILMLGIVFAHTKINFSWKYYALFVVPIITTTIIWTNNIHKLFFVSYSIYSKDAVYGYYYYLHSIYSYTCILVGLIYLGYFSFKNSGFFSKQSILILVGIILPLIINVLYSFNLANLTFNVNSIAFTFSSICFAFAILKFNFLNVVPIALQKVVDLISDGFIVINEDLSIIDYNKTLVNELDGIIKLNRKDNIIEAVDAVKLFDIGKDSLENIIKRAIEKRKTFSFDQHILREGFDKHFTIEITPIFNQDKHIGTIIVLKDITEHKKHIQMINEKNEELTTLNEELNEKNEEATALNEELIATNEQLADNMEKLNQTQNQLVESERLASLGQLIGGIAHNLKTPIMSIAGGFEAIEELAVEIEEDTVGGTLEKDDYIEIAKEIKDWVGKLKAHNEYMSDIITTVKGQAVQMSASSNDDFTLGELLKRIEILMKHELKKAYCTMNTEVSVDETVKLKGEINNLIQVINNLIANAIQSFGEQGGSIDFKVTKDKNSVVFIIKDTGKGISKEVQERLFKSMITTKGKNGTGLGLYMSYSTIKGKFGGDMWFESEEGKGTTFYVSVPIHVSTEKKEVS